MRNFTAITLTVIIYLFCLSIQSKNWTKVTKGQNGHIFFIDMKKLNESNDYIYFWQLINYNKKDEYGDLSAKIYIQGDCKNFKFKWLKVSYHKLMMGEDQVRSNQPSKLVSGWQFPNFGSTSYAVLDYVCKNKGLIL